MLGKFMFMLDWLNRGSNPKSRQPKRYVLTDKMTGKYHTRNFPTEFHRRGVLENPNGGARGEAEELRLVLNAVREFKKRKGIGNVVENEDGTQVSITKREMLSDSWSEHVANMRTIASRKTGKPISGRNHCQPRIHASSSIAPRNLR